MEHFRFMLYNDIITQILHCIEIPAETKVGTVAKFCSTQNEVEHWTLIYESELFTEMDNLISKVDFYPKESDWFSLG